MPESEKTKPPEKVRFVYNKPENYEPIYVSGVYGGMTPRGELVCHFFVEYSDIPAEEHVPLVEGQPNFEKLSKVDRIKHTPAEVVVKRDIKVGLVIPAHQITSVANWMVEKLKASGIIVEKKE